MSIELEPTIHPSIIDQINSLSESWQIIAYNNSTTPFQLVFLVLKSVVPLSTEDAYYLTEKIHFHGEASIYKGAQDRCKIIGDALTQIKVEFKIFQN